jgi:hypothetical protein
MEAMQNPYVILHLVLPFVYVLAFGRCAPSRGFAWCVVAGLAAYETTLLCAALVLGHLEILFPPIYSKVLLAAGSVAALCAAYSLPALVRTCLSIRYKPKLVDLLIAGSLYLFGHITYWAFWFDWTEGPTFFDSVAYHIPRTLMWSWHGNFHPWATAVWHQIGNVVGGSATMLPLALMGRGWLGGAWVGLVLTWGAAAAVYVLAQTFHLNKRASLLAALCFVACPIVGLRMSDLTTDMGASFPVLAGVVLFRTITPLGRAMFYFIALCGVGFACKQYAIFPTLLLSVVLFLPRTKEILFDLKVLLHVIGGVMVAGLISLLSFWPLYEAFGTLSGGNEAMQHSTFAYGWWAAVCVTKTVSINWLFEPLGITHLFERLHLLPDKWTEEFFKGKGLGVLYTSVCGHDAWAPVYTPFNVRSGLLSLLFLPWLILAVKKGYRLLVLALFLVLALLQISVFSINYWSPRFMVICMAGFALLWGARAQKNPILVAFLASLALFADYKYAGTFRHDLTGYSPNREHMRGAVDVVKPGEKLLILSVSLTNDAFWAGRLGQYQFEYVVCPPDGDWVKLFNKMKFEGRWFLLPGNGEVFKPGPSYESRLSKVCPNEKIADLRTALTQAGWKYKLQLPGLHELWTSDPNA